MHPFAYHQPLTSADALQKLAEPGAMALGGGTDLLVCVKEDLAHPDAVVDVRRLAELRGVSEMPDGGVRIGAAMRIHELAHHTDLRARWPMLAEACESVGTVALRHMGTLGGNLCQRPRCWYFRRSIPCLKNGGDDCPARLGENQYHAILEGGPCWIVHPSDPAVALVALGATIVIDGPAGARNVSAESFWVLPRDRMDRETVLADGEIVVAVTLPASSAGGRQSYRKLMQRGSWDFALVSLASARRANGDVRLVLGGVSPRPYRVNTSVEEDVASGGLGEDDAGVLADRALYDAAPLARNGYKVTLAAALLREAIRDLQG